jgi:hypothetical protein
MKNVQGALTGEVGGTLTLMNSAIRMVIGSAHPNSRGNIDNSDTSRYGNSSDYKIIVTGENVPINF